MGGCQSKSGGASPSTREAWVDKRIAELVVSMESRHSEKVHPFNKILLKFPLIRLVFQRVRNVFTTFDTDHSGTIEYSELRNCLEKLGAVCTGNEVTAIFAEADMWEQGKLTYREFLVCLALGHLLGYIPLAGYERSKERPSSAGTSVPLGGEATPDARSGPPSPTAEQVRALISGEPTGALVSNRSFHSEANSGHGGNGHVYHTNTGVLTSGRLDESLRAKSSKSGRRVSFTTAEALAREGDSSAAADLAAAAAAELHMETADPQSTQPVSRMASPESGEMTPASPALSEHTGSAVPPPVSAIPLDKLPVEEHTDYLNLLSGRRSGDANDPTLVAWAFHLCLEAFLQLSSGGFIRKDDLRAGIRQLAMMSPQKGVERTSSKKEAGAASLAYPSSALEFLTDERFAELDWDSDGKITFREFLFAFVNWTGIDDEEESAPPTPSEGFKAPSRSVSRSGH